MPGYANGRPMTVRRSARRRVESAVVKTFLGWLRDEAERDQFRGSQCQLPLGARLLTVPKGGVMPKAYWISCYRAVRDPDKLAVYAKLAAPAILAGGGRFLVRGPAAKAYEQGILQRTVVVEFDDLATANKVHDGPGYQEALRVLGSAVERDFRIVEGVG
jgi:uncharacterized protein (DUF1330 family)